MTEEKPALPTIYTVADIESYCRENREAIDKRIDEFDGMPAELKQTPFMRKIFEAGEFLGTKLRQHGASEERAEEICFAHGQRCFGGDPYEWAIRYLHEFIQTGDTKDRPGEKLAREISNEVLGS